LEEDNVPILKAGRCTWKKTTYQYLKLKEWKQKKIRCAA